MEGGLVTGFAKLVLDADQLTMVPNLVNGIDLSENGQALDALRETGPGQHFRGVQPHAGQFPECVLAVVDGGQ